MAQAPDYFSDMLGPGEVLMATLGGPGPTVERKLGQDKTWFQLAFTQSRLLMVKLVQGPMGGSYQPTQRLAAPKEFTRIARFPRTPVSPARLEIEGCGDPIHVHDIDDPNIFPYVEPFLVAWGGALQGAGAVAARAHDPYDAAPQTDTGKLLVVVLSGIVLLGFICGCGMLATVVKFYILPNL